MTLSSLSVFEKKDVDASISLELVSFNDVQNIIRYRCGTCHAKNPTFEGIEAAPKGVVYDTVQDIINNIKLINLIVLNFLEHGKKLLLLLALFLVGLLLLKKLLKL